MGRAAERGALAWNDSGQAAEVHFALFTRGALSKVGDMTVCICSSWLLVSSDSLDVSKTVSRVASLPLAGWVFPH